MVKRLNCKFNVPPPNAIYKFFTRRDFAFFKFSINLSTVFHLIYLLAEYISNIIISMRFIWEEKHIIQYRCNRYPSSAFLTYTRECLLSQYFISNSLNISFVTCFTDFYPFSCFS